MKLSKSREQPNFSAVSTSAIFKTRVTCMKLSFSSSWGTRIRFCEKKVKMFKQIKVKWQTPNLQKVTYEANQVIEQIAAGEKLSSGNAPPGEVPLICCILITERIRSNTKTRRTLPRMTRVKDSLTKAGLSRAALLFTLRAQWRFTFPLYHLNPAFDALFFREKLCSEEGSSPCLYIQNSPGLIRPIPLAVSSNL